MIEELIKRKKIQVIYMKDKNQVEKPMDDFNIGTGEAEAIWLALKKMQGWLQQTIEMP